MAKKSPDPVDKHVGNRVRHARMILGMSQDRLGASLGLTFQQVQKYEKGSNRISASRLSQIAKALDKTIPWFFEGAPSSGLGTVMGPQPDDPAQILGTTRDGMDLARAFTGIHDPAMRHAIVAVAKAAAAACAASEYPKKVA